MSEMAESEEPVVEERRNYPLPEAIRVTLCPKDEHPTPRTSACWSFCGDACWVTYRDGRPDG